MPINTAKPTMLSEFASKEEYWYSQWLNELMVAGYVADWYYQIPYEVIDKAQISIWKLEDLKYTADFKIEWRDKAEGLFYINDASNTDGFKADDKLRLHYAVLNPVSSQHESIVDVKGSFIGAHNNSAITFPLVRKTLYKTHGVFVNMIKPLADRGLFSTTFSPASIYLTDKTNKERKTSFVKRRLSEYLEQREALKLIVPKKPRTKQTISEIN